MTAPRPTPPHIPELIVTDRLELRAPRLEHVPALTAAVRASLPELKPWMPWATDDYGEAVCEQGVRQAIAAFALREDLRYHLFDRATGELIGSTGYHRIKWDVPRMEIGYWLLSSKTGNGYVTEATRELARRAFAELGAQRVELRCDDRNLASAAVAQRCGFELDGVLQHYVRGTDGSLRAERIYSLTTVSGLR